MNEMVSKEGRARWQNQLTFTNCWQASGTSRDISMHQAQAAGEGIGQWSRCCLQWPRRRFWKTKLLGLRRQTVLICFSPKQLFFLCVFWWQRNKDDVCVIVGAEKLTVFHTYLHIYLHKCTFTSSLALFLVVAHIVPGGESHSDDVMPLTPPPTPRWVKTQLWSVPLLNHFIWFS